MEAPSFYQDTLTYWGIETKLAQQKVAMGGGGVVDLKSINGVIFMQWVDSLVRVSCTRHTYLPDTSLLERLDEVLSASGRTPVLYVHMYHGNVRYGMYIPNSSTLSICQNLHWHSILHTKLG